MGKTKWQAAFARLCNFCKKHNELAQAETERHAKIAWITREIEKFDDSRLNRIVILVKQIKE
nr:MAG TPA: Double-stranded RNA binding domain 2 [Caudoviricetes sp.]